MALAPTESAPPSQGFNGVSEYRHEGSEAALMFVVAHFKPANSFSRAIKVAIISELKNT